jgi:hypothetical protein
MARFLETSSLLAVISFGALTWNSLQTHSPTVVVWSILFWTAVAFGFRLLYLLKIAFVAGAEDGFSNGNGSEKPPLESQRKATGNLLAASAADVDMPGYRIVALRGPWGSGKSTIVRNFVTEASRKNIVVEIQAWEHEAEADLEIAIMRGLTRSWRVIWPLGWVTIPVMSGLSGILCVGPG